MRFRARHIFTLLDGDAGISPTGVMQSVRAGVLHPPASCVASAPQGAAPRKPSSACLGRDANGSTFAWTAHGLRLGLQCEWPARQHKHLTPATHAFCFVRDVLANKGAAANSRPALRLTMMDGLNIHIAPNALRPAVAELGR